jgi:hypothetical protein
MGPLDIQEVISKSFKAFKIALEAPEETSIQLIIDNLSDDHNQIALPYLQVYLDILYREEYARTIGHVELTGDYPILPLTKDEITELGKIDDVLNKFLDEQEANIYQELKKDHPNINSQVVSNVLDVFVTEEGTKKPVHITRDGKKITFNKEITNRFPNMDGDLLEKIVRALESSRLLFISNDSVEIAHDMLAALVEDRRSEEQKLRNQLRRRLINSFEEYKDSGTFLTRRQYESYLDFLPTLRLEPALSDFIEKSKLDIERKEVQVIENQRKQLEAEQEIKKAELVRQKLEAEKKAKRRLAIGATIIGLLLPVIAFMWFTAFSRGNEIEVQKSKVDQLLTEAKTDNLALSKVNSELNFVKSILDTINQTGVSDSSLYALVAQAVSSIDALKEDKVIEEVKQNESHVVRAFTTGKRGGKNKKQTFKKGDVVYVYSYLKIPRGGDNITMIWKTPEGQVYHRNSSQMGFNWEDGGGEFWTAKGQLRTSGKYTIEIINGKKEVIHELNFKVE